MVALDVNRCPVSAYSITSVIAILPLIGCATFQNAAHQNYVENRRWSIATTYTTADVRMISERKHPVLHNMVVCTEPSPDVAKALSTALTLALKGETSTTSGSVTSSAGTSETALALAGRSTALLALRDGLYRACEAYANGALGADAYALVLSRYGQLMTTLFLGQDIAGTASTETGGSKTSPLININTGPSSAGDGGQTNPPQKGGKDTSSTPTAQQPPQNEKQASQEPPPGGPVTVSLSAGTAVALTRMNEDYFALDERLSHLLVVACINEADPTRLHVPPLLATGSAGQGQNTNQTTDIASADTIQNPWLKPFCDYLSRNPENLWKIILEQEPKFDIVNPASTLTQAPQASGAQQLAPELIAAAQRILKKYNPKLMVDGKLSQETKDALVDFQKKHNLKSTGELDLQTLAELLKEAAPHS